MDSPCHALECKTRVNLNLSSYPAAKMCLRSCTFHFAPYPTSLAVSSLYFSIISERNKEETKRSNYAFEIKCWNRGRDRYESANDDPIGNRWSNRARKKGEKDRDTSLSLSLSREFERTLGRIGRNRKVSPRSFRESQIFGRIWWATRARFFHRRVGSFHEIRCIAEEKKDCARGTRYPPLGRALLRLANS